MGSGIIIEPTERQTESNDVTAKVLLTVQLDCDVRGDDLLVKVGRLTRVHAVLMDPGQVVHDQLAALQVLARGSVDRSRRHDVSISGPGDGGRRCASCDDTVQSELCAFFVRTCPSFH